MAMSKEELLKPRVKVMGYYPHSPYETGDVLTFQKNDPDDLFDTSTYSGGNGREYADEVEKSPLIFQPLPWYAERDIKNMPEYVAYDGKVSRVRVLIFGDESKGEPYCVEGKYNGNGLFNLDNQYQLKGFSWNEVEPADKSDYDKYINSKK